VGDAAEKGGCKVAQRRCVVLAAGHQALVLRGQLRVDFPGAVGGHEQGFAEEFVTGLG